MSDCKQTGQNQAPQRPAMTPEAAAKMKEQSMAILEVEFHNKSGSLRFWSKCGQRKHRDLRDATNYLFWLVNKKWHGKVLRAAIFDARNIKTSCAANKIHQYENGVWEVVQPVTW